MRVREKPMSDWRSVSVMVTVLSAEVGRLALLPDDGEEEVCVVVIFVLLKKGLGRVLECCGSTGLFDATLELGCAEYGA